MKSGLGSFAFVVAMITFCTTPALNPLELPSAHSGGWFVRRFPDGVCMWVYLSVCGHDLTYSVVSIKI